MSNLMWETFVAGLVDEYTHSSNSDRVLWRVVKANRDIVCRERDLCTGNSYVSLELSVAHNGQVFRTEVHKERVAFYRRVDELSAMLEAEGWTTTTNGLAS